MKRRVANSAIVFCLCCLALAGERPGVWLDVPFVQQEKEGCGAASIAMVMQYWLKQQGRAVDASADAVNIQQSLHSSEARGIYASALEGYLQRTGFRTFSFRGKWEDLREHLEKGRPLLVALKPADGAPLHYVVVAGLDWERRLAMVNDPAQRKLLKQDRASFEQQWSAAGNWTLLALPRQATP